MLDVLIGLVTVYLTFGIACTAFVEAISTIAGLRGKNLQDGIGTFFKGTVKGKQGELMNFVDAFYAHPLIVTLSKNDNSRPSYIPTEIVGHVVTSLLGNIDSAESLNKALDSMPGDNPGDNRIKDLFNEFYNQSKGDVEIFRQKAETHFDATMERVTGWFKRKTQFIAIIISIFMVVFANVDTVDIARSLATSPETRAALVQSAEKLLNEQKELLKTKTSEDTDLKKVMQKKDEALAFYHQSIADLETTGLKLGWEKQPQGYNQWLAKIAGLLASALAISLGAPFWFQVLQRFMQVRGAGVNPKEKKS